MTNRIVVTVGTLSAAQIQAINEGTNPSATNPYITQSQLDAVVVDAGDTNAEVVSARAGFASLDARLDDMTTDIAAIEAGSGIDAYTVAEVDTLLDAKADVAHTQASTSITDFDAAVNALIAAEVTASNEIVGTDRLTIAEPSGGEVELDVPYMYASYMVMSGTNSITNPAAAESEQGNQKRRARATLTLARQAKINIPVTVPYRAAGGGATVTDPTLQYTIKYSTDGTTFSHLDGGTGVWVSGGPVAFTESAWFNLTAGAKASVILAVFSKGGLGSGYESEVAQAQLEVR